MMMRYLDEAVETCENLLHTGAQTSSAEASNTQSWTQACQAVGNVLTGMGFVEESYPWRSMALDESPDGAKFYAESGRIYSECEAWDRAIYFCQRTLEYQPENISIRHRLANIYHQTGRYRKESQVINELLSIQPDKANAEGHHTLGQLLAKQGQLEAAKTCYERAIAQDSQYVSAYYALGELLIQQQQWLQAIELFEHLVEQSKQLEDKAIAVSTQATAHYRLGRVYRQSNQLEPAVAEFKQALKLDPQLHWAYMGLLNTLMQMQRWDEVIAPCQNLIHRAEEFPWICTFLGNAFANKEEWTQAADAHQQAFSLRGWLQCAERKYTYSQTWFAQSIPLWEEALAANNLLSAMRSPIQALSIGIQDDAMLFWLADKVLSHPDDRLACIATKISSRLKQNIEKLAQPQNLVIKEGIDHPLSELKDVEAGTLSIAVVQRDYVWTVPLQSLISEVWMRLAPNGILVIKDSQWQHPDDPSLSAPSVIDAFVAAAGDQAEVMHRSHQIFIRRNNIQVISKEALAQEIPNV